MGEVSHYCKWWLRSREVDDLLRVPQCISVRARPGPRLLSLYPCHELTLLFKWTGYKNPMGHDSKTGLSVRKEVFLHPCFSPWESWRLCVRDRLSPWLRFQGKWLQVFQQVSRPERVMGQGEIAHGQLKSETRPLAPAPDGQSLRGLLRPQDKSPFPREAAPPRVWGTPASQMCWLEVGFCRYWLQCTSRPPPLPTV